MLEQLVRPLGEVTPDELELVTGAPIPEGQWRAELERAAAALVARDYDLDTGAGLLRACLLRLSPDRHAFVQAAHHIVMDGGGATAFHRQVFEGYGLLRDGPSALSEPPLQYIDYSHARERWLGSPAGKKNEEFWRDYVRGARPVILEGDFPRASIDARRDASPRGVTADLSYPPEVMSLPNEIYASVAAAARTARTTPYVIFMAALAWLLRERSGQHDLAIQSTYNSRVEDPALAQVNGCITTWTLTRIDLDGAMRFADAIARTRVAVGIVQDHAAPGDYYGIVPHGLRRVVFNYMPVGPAVGHAAASDVPASEIRVKPYPWGFPIWKRTWDLHLTVSDNGSSPQLFWTGFSQLFRRESVRALLARYVELLARAV